MSNIKKNFLGFTLRRLANLKFAIVLLFLIGLIISVGTIIEQNQSLSYYKLNYPEITPIFGFIDWRFIVFFNLNKIYTSYWFLVLLFVFASSLISCTFVTQLPSLKKFKLWKFLNYYNQFERLNLNSQFKYSSNNLAYKLHKNNYHLFRQNKKNYAYSGLLGRIGPIFVHFSILFLILGSTYSAFSSFTAQEITPRGEIFHVQNLLKLGNTSYVPQSFAWRVNDFWITYTKELRTNQFYSDLSLLDSSGYEVKRKTIFVNEPFVYKDITVYQTDWDVLGIKCIVDKNQTVQLPLKKLTLNNRKVWVGSLPLDVSNGKIKTYTIVINDLFGNLLLYDDQGQLISSCLVGQEIKLNNNTDINFAQFITTTGLQIKTDFGLPFVYFSFFLLIISSFISFISYSQIWELETSTNLLVAGKSNRAVLFFQENLKRFLQSS